MVLAGLLEGSLFSPILATVLGGVFGLLSFVLLNAAGLDVKMHYGIAVVVAVVAAGAINLFLKPNVHISDGHH